jgi:hypothetical protein
MAAFKGLFEARLVFWRVRGQQNEWMSARLSAAKGPQGAANDLNAESPSAHTQRRWFSINSSAEKAAAIMSELMRALAVLLCN